MHDTSADARAARLAAGPPGLPGLFDLPVDDLSLRGLLDALRACVGSSRAVDAVQAQVLACIAQIAAKDRVPGVTESEVTASTLWPVSTVKNRLADAATLSERFPETLAALAAGLVSQAQARSLVAQTTGMSDEHARAVQALVLARLPELSDSRGRAAIQRAVTLIDPEGAAQRHAEAVKRRHVEYRPELEGMATLALFTKADTARAILNHLDALCRKKLKGDHRTLDQRRADTLAEIALTGTTSTATKPPTAPARVHLIMNVETLIGWADAPAELEGYGTITAHEARMMALAPGSELRRLFTAPSGKLLAVDPRKYRWSAALERLVQATHRTCTFQGCEMQAHRCDLDHRDPFSKGGYTCEHNLHPACRFHHGQKTAGMWSVHTEGDATVWVSTATGRRYVTHPEPYPVIDYNDLIE
jgi:hypothetical protein